MASSFVPRAVFPATESIPRAYFLGHHRAGLTKMVTMLSSIDLVIECRDYRVPLSSRNPLLEHSLAGRPKLTVYTKRDLGSQGRRGDREREDQIRAWHDPSPVVFCSHRNDADVREIVTFVKGYAPASMSLTGSRAMVVGMPNVGKSTLLNALRRVELGRGKAARTGAQPGVTRKIGTMVKIVEGADESQSVYLLDTPGVFIPYVPDYEAMLKLALCGSVKDALIDPAILADYLLFRLNLVSPDAYRKYHRPTNDVDVLLEAVARYTGRLRKGGLPDVTATAIWMVQQWRVGCLGQFVLDEVAADSLEKSKLQSDTQPPSTNQLRKAVKRERSLRSSRQTD